MISSLQLLVLLLAVVAATAVLAEHLKIPPAILLALTGIAIALVPGLPSVEIAPDLMLLLVLPPLIYSSAVAMSCGGGLPKEELRVELVIALFQ